MTKGIKVDKKSAWYYYFFGVFAGIFLVALFFLFFQLRPHHMYYASSRPFANPDKFNVPILVYHYVEYVKDTRDTIRRSLNITPYVFENQILSLKLAGFTFITPGDINDILSDKRIMPKNPIILSFDDGYEDFYTDVLPILKKNNVKAVQYVVSGFLDQPNYMSRIQVREVIKSGLVEIGCHTVNHPNLKSIPLSFAEQEIVGCKKDLFHYFGINVTSFAYPYGAYNELLFPILKKAGFNNAVTAQVGIEISQANLFEIPRIRPGGRMGDELISYIESEIAKNTTAAVAR